MKRLMFVILALSVSASIPTYGELGTWTTSGWLSVVPAVDNLVKGMVPTATEGTYANNEGGKNPALLTDGKGAAGDSGQTQCINNNGSLSFDFEEEVCIKEVRVYSTWHDTGRNGLFIKSVQTVDATGTVAQIGGQASRDVELGNCAILSASGSYLAMGVTNVTINFASQDNGHGGYAEIEVIGQVGRPSGLTGINLSVEPGLAPYVATATVLSVAPLSDAATYAWTLDGETVGGNAASVELNIANPGAYMLEVTVVDDGKTMTATQDVSVYPETIYVNAQASNSTFPYWSPETGATNLMDAVNTYKGRTILVYPGYYPISAEILLTAGKKLKGVGSPSDAVIRQTASNLRVVAVSGAGAEVAGLTLSGGKSGLGGTLYVANGAFCHDCHLVDGEPERNTGGGGCLYIEGAASVISNCVIGNVVRNTEKGISGIYYGLGVRLNGGLVTDCVITNVQALGMHRSSGHAQGAAVHMTGGTLRNSLIAHNRVTNGAEGSDRQFAAGLYQTGGNVENCTITDNTSGSGPAGYYLTRTGSGKMVNTIVWNNGNNDTAGTYGDANLAGTAAAGMSFCCTNDPNFKSSARLDYGLRGLSACINAGTNLDWTAKAVDLSGKRRVRGGKVDIGCYEFCDDGLMLFLQ